MCIRDSDQTTGICNKCQNGYTRQRCELEISTAVLSTGINQVIPVTVIFVIVIFVQNQES